MKKKKREDHLKVSEWQQQKPVMAGVSKPKAGFASVSQPTQAGFAQKKYSFSAPDYPTLTPLKEYLGPKSLKQLNKGDIIKRKDKNYYKVIDPNVQGPTFTTTETEIEKIKNFTMYGVGDNVIYTPCNTKLFKNPRGGEVLANLIKGKVGF